MSGADGSLWFDTQIDSKKFNKGIKTINSQASGLQKTISNLGKTIITAFGVTQIVQFAKTSIQASNEIENSLIGLQSIVEGQGKSFQKAKKFVEEYVSDGLVPLNNAATAYKNLAARGYNEQQIQSVMIALKDSAAFGRQANLSLGEAVQNATEGLKNENSILVDNAGVTKNVAKMWDDYAKSIGTTANNLTQQQKIQAEVTGILEETKFQTGDAAKIAETYSGQILKLQFEFSNLQVAVGNFLKPIITTFLPVINASVQAVTRFANSLANVSEALFGKQTQQANAIATSVDNQKELTKETRNTAKAADKTQASFDEIQKLTQGSTEGASGGASVGITEDAISVEADVVQNELNNIQLPEGLVTLIDSLKQGLSEISFDNLNNGLTELGVALAPYTEFVWSGLTWLWEKILQPLAEWTIEELLPNFLNLLATVLNVLASVINALKPVGEWLWNNFLQPIAKWTGGEIVDDLIKLSDALKKLPSIISNIGTIFEDIWKSFIEPILTNFMDLVDWLWLNHLKPLADNIGGLVSELINLAMQIFNNVISPIVKWVIEYLLPAIRNTLNVIVNMLGSVIATVVDIINGIIKTLKGVVQFIVGVFTGEWEKAWEGITNIFGGIWDAIVGIVKGAINLIIDFINGMIAGLETALNWIVDKVNSLQISNPFTGDEIWSPNIPSFKLGRIPKLATGTVVPANYGNFLAMLGDNKRETEVVSPLSTMKQALKEALAESGQNITINFEESSIGDLVRLLKPYIDKENRRVGSSTRVAGGAY